MSIYMQLASNDSYVKSLTNELPNSATPYDDQAFLQRFKANLLAERAEGTVSPLLVIGEKK